MATSSSEKSQSKQSAADKDCTVCTDFKDWMSGQQQQSQRSQKKSKPATAAESSQKTNAISNKADQETSVECPLYRDQLGRATWSFLHTMAAYYPPNPSESQQTSMQSFIQTFSQFFPCHECAEDFQEEIKKSPPRVKSNLDLSQWFCEQHNIVNNKLGKEQFDCSKVFERWKKSSDPRCNGGL